MFIVLAMVLTHNTDGDWQMKFVAAMLILIGVVNDIIGFFTFIKANGAIHEIVGLCIMILATLQFILAKMLWPKDTQ